MDVDNQHQTHDLSSSKQAQVVVIMVPFPAQSHLNQLLQLSCLISSYNIPVHYACSATHIHQAKLRFNDTNHLSFAQIHFHEFPTPPFLSSPPNPNASSKFPSHFQPSFEASVHLHNPMTELLQEISSTARRVIIVHDALMAYVVEEPQGLPSVEGCYTLEVLNFITLQTGFLKFTWGSIMNSCRSIEALQEGVVASSTIAEAVKKLMASIEGEEMRKRAEELAVAARKAVEDGGVSRMELGSFIAHITR
ncbi:Zeatin O-glucosyltransferase [Camellia lanceoleosa]|uniref:Zeatin O-glucosyltransferase n=1 Tax=Camellia lanceoleosa TaxID=1840588 RepID=A0ACC0GB15_9ERIC|nr:Zeatin O-glucosyltransferase [Camellia lanceoleosa]